MNSHNKNISCQSGINKWINPAPWKNAWHKALGCKTRTGFVPHELSRKRIVLKERRNPASIHNGSRNHCRLPRRWISAPLFLCSGYCIADNVCAGVSGLFLYALGWRSRDILLFMGICAHDCTTVLAIATCETPPVVTNGYSTHLLFSCGYKRNPLLLISYSLQE